MIQPERIEPLNNAEPRAGKYVLYWMQAAQRAHCNHALEHAIRLANERGRPLVAAFGLTADYPDANLRHYAFMLEGLRHTAADLARRKIAFVVRRGSPDQVAIDLGADADAVVTDTGFLRIQRDWRQSAAVQLGCPLIEVETNLIVPVEEASDKENFSAGTLRPRIHRRLDRYLVPLKTTAVKRDSTRLRIRGMDLSNTDTVLKGLKIDRSVPPAPGFRGGTDEALKRLDAFLAERLDEYGRHSDPSLDFESHLSPYLHFGQISPLHIALEVLATGSPGKDEFLEQLIVRRELAFNFVRYNPKYDQYDGLPDWARRTLNLHARDKREPVYSLEEFERGRTHDPFWNAAQRQMTVGGKMHNYMRMYWGKKILEWSASPREAFEIALRLNNRYELDGRDPNGYAGVAWCFGKHDRAWGERPIFGKVRYMNAAGLKRKFDMQAYLDRVAQLES